MKKLFAILLAVSLLASMATIVSAAGNTTTLTTTVPSASYTLNIPADQEIPFGAENTAIEVLSVSNAKGFAVGKNLAITISYDAFKSQGVSTTIPYTVRIQHEVNSLGRVWKSGETLNFLGRADGTLDELISFYDAENGQTYNSPIYGEEYFILMDSSDWGKALAGEYTSTITFTAEVVVE